jgi:FkbM family methyltransferase
MNSGRQILLRRIVTHVRNGTLHKPILFRTRNFFFERQQSWRRYVRQRRKAWWNANSRPDAFHEYQLEPRIKMRLYFDSELCRLIYLDGFEAEEREFLHAFLRTGDVFVDVGANIGLFTLTAADIVGPTGMVHAFEPCGRTYDRLVTNIGLNGYRQVHCHRVALSDLAGSANLTVCGNGMDAWNSIGKPYIDGPARTEEVRTGKWDEFATANALVGQVRFIKIDVEGWERQVLLGGAETLARADAPVLQVEFADPCNSSEDPPSARLYKAIEQLGYTLFQFDNRTYSMVPEPRKPSYAYSNLYAIKRLDEVLERLNEARRLNS